MERLCVDCGETFSGGSKAGRCLSCSRRHAATVRWSKQGARDSFRAAWSSSACENCGGPCRYSNGGRFVRFCNLPDCVRAGNRARSRETFVPAPLVGGDCPICGAQFWGNAKKRYCSQRCGNAAVLARRREGQLPPKTNKVHRKSCERCSSEFMGKRHAKFCSRACGIAVGNVRFRKTTDIVPYRVRRVWLGSHTTSNRVWAQGPCAYCGASFVGLGAAARFCSEKCRSNAAWQRRGRDFSVSPRVRLEIYERDGWVCHLCLDPVDSSLHYLDPGAATLDHIIPQSVARDDSPENLKLAHRICNSRRGARLLEDLYTEMV